ncbi:IS630 family transposase [Domibacillus antri]|uniref:IS630 family transposase n=1 Tax=Domibacillus antri TaxID=1714264 RepID=UPI0009F8FCAF|nr:IS630 family transposase [Domibacillus antri]
MDACLVVEWVEREWQVSYSLQGMSLVLHHLGFSHTRPTYTLENAYPVKQQTFVEDIFPALKKLLNEEIHHILFQDESMTQDYQAIQKTWFLKGKQRIIPTYGRHQGVKLIGTLNYETGEIFCIEEETYDAAIFLAFLEKVLAHYSTGKIIMILDNARIHHAKLLQPFLQANQHRIQLVFLPPYSPQLNLIEGLWKWMKEAVINNVFFSSTSKIKQVVHSFIDAQNTQKDVVINRLCGRF